METAADRLAYFKACGVQVTLQRLLVKWYPWAILDYEFVAINGMEAYRPRLLLRDIDAHMTDMDQVDAYLATSAILALPEGQVTMNVVGYESDGTGLCALILERQS